MYRDDNGHFMSWDNWLSYVARKLLNWGWSDAIEILSAECRKIAGRLCEHQIGRAHV